MSFARTSLGACVLGITLLVPWLNPFSAGPTPAVVPWLVSALCALLVWTLKARLTAYWVAAAWLLAAVVSSAIGLLQYFDQVDWLGMWANRAQVGEAYANLRQRNQFATLTSIGLLAWLFLLDRPMPGLWGGENPRRWALGWLSGLGVVMLALGNAASGSRTGLLQWLAVGALTLVWHPRGDRRRVAASGIAIALYLASVLVLPWLLAMVTGVYTEGLPGRLQEETGCASRRILWSNVIHLIAQKPWLGWGWGELDYAHFVTLYPGERFCDILDNAHNLPLHMAVELGVPFALTVCAAIVGGVVWFRPWREMDPTRQLAWGVLTVIALHSLLEYPLWYGPFQMAALLSLGLLCQRLPSKRPLDLAQSFVIAIIFMAFIGWAGFDYWRISQLYVPVSERSPAYRDDTLSKVRGSVLFSDQVAFAEFTTTTVTQDNAQRLLDTGLHLLHFSPEPRVIEKLIESAVVSGQDEAAAFHVVRYRAAFPEAYARWMADSASHETP